GCQFGLWDVDSDAGRQDRSLRSWARGPRAVAGRAAVGAQVRDGFSVGVRGMFEDRREGPQGRRAERQLHGRVMSVDAALKPLYGGQTWCFALVSLCCSSS